MADDYENMTVAELKELLKEQGLPVSGKKADLIERLAGAAEQDDAPVEETEAASDAEEDDDFFEDDDDWDDDEDEVHVAKQKPVLDEATQEALAFVLLRRRRHHLPSNRMVPIQAIVSSGWRAPHGMDNKQRRNFKYRGSSFVLDMASCVRTWSHPSGFRKSWSTTSTIWKPSIQNQAARIGRTVGGRKRENIHARADELGIRILNRRRNV